jgi:hypothetical protein
MQKSLYRQCARAKHKSRWCRSFNYPKIALFQNVQQGATMAHSIRSSSKLSRTCLFLRGIFSGKTLVFTDWQLLAKAMPQDRRSQQGAFAPATLGVVTASSQMHSPRHLFLQQALPAATETVS